MGQLRELEPTVRFEPASFTAVKAFNRLNLLKSAAIDSIPLLKSSPSSIPAFVIQLGQPARIPRMCRFGILMLAIMANIVAFGCQCLPLSGCADGEMTVRAQNAQPPVAGQWADQPPANGPFMPSGTAEQHEQPPARANPTRPLHLSDAIHRALSQTDVVRTLNGSVEIPSITGFDPLIADAQWQSANTVFDPRLRTEYEGSQINKPPSSFFGPGIEARTLRDEGNFSAALEKDWAIGTTTRVAYDPSLGYLYFPQGTSPDEFNPSYSSDFVFEVRQPLLRGAGKDVNVAPIFIAQTRIDQSIWEVRELTLAMVRSVEEAYWDLQAAHLVRKSIEEVLPLAEEAVRVEELRFKSERSIYADVARARVQLESFQQQQLRAERDQRTKEYQLRQLIGMPVDDGTWLLPIDAPMQAIVQFDPRSVLAIALDRRPDLNRRRSRVEANEWELLAAQNARYPQLDVFAAYRTSGLGERLDDALHQARGLDYSDWTLGASFEVPLGNRKAKAEINEQQLRLTKERVLLTQHEIQVSFQLAELQTEIEIAWKRFQSAMRQSQSAHEWLKLSRIRYSSPPAGSGRQDSLLIALYDYQQAMQSHIDAITSAGEYLARYNSLLARLDEAQGILLDKRNVRFMTDLPADQPYGAPVINPTQGHVGHVSTAATISAANPFGHTYSTHRNAPQSRAVSTSQQQIRQPTTRAPAGYRIFPTGHSSATPLYIGGHSNRVR